MKKVYAIALTGNCFGGYAQIGGIIPAHGKEMSLAYPTVYGRYTNRLDAENAAMREYGTTQVVRRLPNGRGWRIVGYPWVDIEEE